MARKAEAARGARKQKRQGTPAGTVRKNFDLPQAAIDRAREATADLAAFRQATDAALAELVGQGGFEDHCTPPAEQA